MLKIRLVLFLGIWIAVLPYLGFPLIIKNLLFSLTGLGLIYFSLVLYKKRVKSVERKKPDSYTENGKVVIVEETYVDENSADQILSEEENNREEKESRVNILEL